MTKKFLRRMALCGLALAVPTLLTAQEVNRKKYPDFTWELNPDPSLMVVKRSPEAARVGAQRPTHVNNAELKFFPPVFNQDGGSCGSASRIRYMFTHELNAYRNLDGSVDENNYPTHFVWLLTNGNSGKDEFIQYVGVPSAATYGGKTYSSLFGYQEETYNNFGWMTGYDKWYEAMHNRMLKPTNFPISVATEEGREAVKNWLWNHNGDPDFYGGGIVGIGVASGGEWKRIPSTTANDAAGVTNKYYVGKWGTSVDHALTIVGYDDRIEFDLNGNGIKGEKSADEVGAWIVANSWGGWCNNGFIYCPYAYGGAWFNSDGTFGNNSWWFPEVYRVRKNYRPLRTIRLKMDYSRRSEICLSAGISSDLNATQPERTITFDHFKYAGDGNGGNTNPAPEIPMLGKWADGRLHTEPMEFGYDLTDLSANFDKNMPLKYFFIVETRSWGKGSGHIYEASIIDYEHELSGLETPFNLPSNGYTITSAGNKTIISTIVYGQGFYAPQNVAYNEGTLTWSAPISSGHEVTAYHIYREGERIATVDGNVLTYKAQTESDQVTYAVTAQYGNDNVESSKASVNTPIPTGVALNTSLQLKNTGLTIPEIFSTRYENATIEFWFKASSLADWNQSAGNWGTFMMHANSNGAFTAGWNTNGHRVDGNSGDLQVNTWKHVAIVVQGNTLTTYINGIRKGSVTSNTYSGLGGFGDLVFSSSSGSAWNGYIDELRIWNVARTAQEILSYKNSEFAGSRLPKNLLAYYRGQTFQKDGVTYLRDYVGTHHAPIADASKVALSRNTQPKLTSPTVTLTASIDAPSGNVYAGIPVTLTSTCSESAVKTMWNAAGAGLSNVAVNNPTLTFTSTGNQTVTLTAYNASGESVTATRTINVQSAPAADASFKATLSEVPTGDRVTFIATSPALGYQYEWTMPGAKVEKATTTNASAIYTKPGTYIVTLKVSAPGGSSRTSQQTIRVVDVAPVADFQISPAVVSKGEPISLKDLSTHGPTEWQWLMHSAAKDYLIIGQHATVTPEIPGVYDLTLTTRNAAGTGTKTQSRAITVCNANSQNGLNLGTGGASVTATGRFMEASQTNFTVEWWMNTSHTSTYCAGIGNSESTMLLKTDGNGAMSLYLADKSATSANNFVVPGEWHHYAVVFEQPVVYFYRDGVQITKKALNKSINQALTTLTIGGANVPFNGSIDEFRFWNVSRSVDQIRETANQPISDVAAAEQAGLVLYYDFNQTSGSVQDRTSHGYHGQRNGFGPDGDAWGLSRGVFSLNFGTGDPAEDITFSSIANYKKAFSYNSGQCVNSNGPTRFMAIQMWKLARTSVNGGITTGVHVDTQKDACFTCTTEWDGFATSLADHAAYQTITLPAGTYTFTAYYDDTYEGECGNSYLVVANGAGLPTTSNIASQAIASQAMSPKSSTVKSNSVTFTLSKESTISLGLVINMSGKQCLAIKQFSLERLPVTVIEGSDNAGYELKVDASGYASLYLPYAAIIPEGVEAYTVTGINGQVCQLTQLTDGILPAATGVVISAEPGTYHFAPTTSSLKATTYLVGQATNWNALPGVKYYTFAQRGEDVGFYPYSGILQANQAYLALQDGAEAPAFLVTDIFPTGIHSLETGTTDSSNATIYDLSGRRVNQAERGVYIIKGRKVIVK